MTLTFTLELHAELDARVRAAAPDLTACAREAFALQLFRAGTFSHFDLGQALGLDRFQTDAVLQRYQVLEHSLTHAELDEEAATFDRLFGPAR